MDGLEEEEGAWDLRLVDLRSSSEEGGRVGRGIEEEGEGGRTSWSRGEMKTKSILVLQVRELPARF